MAAAEAGADQAPLAAAQAKGAVPGDEELAAAEAQVEALEEALAGDEAEFAKAAAEAAAREAQARRRREEVAEAKQRLALLQARLDPSWRDWAGGVPADVLVKVAEALVAQTEAGWAAWCKREFPDWSEERIQADVEKWKRKGNCLFVFARVCKEWRKAQLRVGGPLCTRVDPDVMVPGRVAMVKWALAEGCPRETPYHHSMVSFAADYGHLELLKWLIEEQGFTMDEDVMRGAVVSGNLKVVQWLWAEGCPWDTRACSDAADLKTLQWVRASGGPWDESTCATAAMFGDVEMLRWARENGCPWTWETCKWAADEGHVEVLRWARENGCEWVAETRDEAAELGYTDDFGNLVDHDGNPIPWDGLPSDDEYSDEYSDDE